MLLRLRLGRGAVLRRRPQAGSRVAFVLAPWFSPAAWMAAALGLWGLGAEKRLAVEFPFPAGIWSRWQFWFSAAAALQAVSFTLDRLGRRPPPGSHEERPPSA